MALKNSAESLLLEIIEIEIIDFSRSQDVQSVEMLSLYFYFFETKNSYMMSNLMNMGND